MEDYEFGCDLKRAIENARAMELEEPKEWKPQNMHFFAVLQRYIARRERHDMIKNKMTLKDEYNMAVLDSVFEYLHTYWDKYKQQLVRDVQFSVSSISPYLVEMLIHRTIRFHEIYYKTPRLNEHVREIIRRMLDVTEKFDKKLRAIATDPGFYTESRVNSEVYEEYCRMVYGKKDPETTAKEYYVRDGEDSGPWIQHDGFVFAKKRLSTLGLIWLAMICRDNVSMYTVKCWEPMVDFHFACAYLWATICRLLIPYNGNGSEERPMRFTRQAIGLHGASHGFHIRHDKIRCLYDLCVNDNPLTLLNTEAPWDRPDPITLDIPNGRSRPVREYREERVVKRVLME